MVDNLVLAYLFLSLTCRAAETFSLLSPFGVTQDVDDERGKLTSVETG